MNSDMTTSTLIKMLTDTGEEFVIVHDPTDRGNWWRVDLGNRYEHSLLGGGQAGKVRGESGQSMERAIAKALIDYFINERDRSSANVQRVQNLMKGEKKI